MIERKLCLQPRTQFLHFLFKVIRLRALRKKLHSSRRFSVIFGMVTPPFKGDEVLQNRSIKKR